MIEIETKDAVAITRLEADVLVLGGGPAGTWAAIAAAEEGACVVLADKGFCGSSGAAAPSGNGIWYVEETLDVREKAMASREALGGYLQDREWMQAVLDHPGLDRGQHHHIVARGLDSIRISTLPAAQAYPQEHEGRAAA
jgi:glycine/D-amino acid oxidase-like deaminating enzyme